MRLSGSFGKTLRKPPGDAEMTSHRLLVQAGFIQQVAAGIFNYLPMGLRCMEKIKNIIREEMEEVGAQEIQMPLVQPRELWEESGRADSFVPPLAGFKDRRGRSLILAPTHEETVTAMVRANLSSYRDLPFSLYQIQTKFRDEPRPRAGLLRVREFDMKDAYSFDADESGLETSYRAMVGAYERIFNRCGLDVAMVEADSGPIGGKDSNEFILIAESGEDTILDCPQCAYAANAEKANFRKPPLLPEEPGTLTSVHTPGVRTISELSDFLCIPTSRTIKAVFYSVNNEILMTAIRGDLEVNETKLRNVLGGIEPRIATQDEVTAAGLVAGSASPVGLKDIRVISDDSLTLGTNFVAGANQKDHHLRNVNLGRDFCSDLVADIALAAEGYQCLECDGLLRTRKGIEIGHVFKLGTSYAESMQAMFLDESGRSCPAVMGCYGIGIGRLLAAAVEANHDEKGMTLPHTIAPYEVYLAALNTSDLTVVSAADAVYEELMESGTEVLYDDRDEPPGVKFNDADLLGIPLRIVVSKRSLKNGGVEIKQRELEKSLIVELDTVLRSVRSVLSR